MERKDGSGRKGRRLEGTMKGEREGKREEGECKYVSL